MPTNKSVGKNTLTSKDRLFFIFLPPLSAGGADGYRPVRPESRHEPGVIWKKSDHGNDRFSNARFSDKEAGFFVRMMNKKKKTLGKTQILFRTPLQSASCENIRPLSKNYLLA